MRQTPWVSLLCASSLALACSDDSIAESATLSSSSGASTGASTTNDSTSLDPTTGGPTSDTSGDGTTTTSSSTTDAPTSSDGTTGTTSTGSSTDTSSTSSGTDSSTGPGVECGNALIEGGEVCDGVDLGGATCQSEGFDGGELACLADCSALDTSGCTMAGCGDGAINGGELCDGADLGGATCMSEGFDGGVLGCAADCLGLDTSGCGTCGNGIVEADEVCDGDALLDQTCASQGFDSGVLACLGDCSALDPSGCGTCGNAVIDGEEACDGADLGGETCQSQGMGGGQLACLDTCELDLSGCGPLEGSLVTVRTSDRVLRALDPVALTFTDIGPLGVGFDFGEVAWDETQDILWMIDGRPQESLYTVNINTGAASLVGLHGVEDLFGLAHDPTTNTLYGSGESPTGFYSLNQANGAPSFIGDPALAADGLTYDSARDQIIALAAGSGELFAIDRATGAPTVLSTQGFINNCGLAYDPILDVYWAIDWSGNLYRYDPNANYTRTLVLSNLSAHDGFTYIPGFMP